MKLIISSFLFFGLSGAAILHAEIHNEGDGANASRLTNTFADYDTLATKFENWGKKLSDESHVESIDSDKKNFVIQLTKAESDDAAKLLRRIKWYRNEIVSCENADASAKVLGSVLDECIAPGALTKAAQNATEKSSRWEMTLSSQELISCQLRISDYFKDKLDSKTGIDANKFTADREISEKIASLFKLFTPSKAEIKTEEKISGDLFDSLQAVRVENRCEVGVTKTINQVASIDQTAIPKMPPATQPVQYPPTSLVQKQPEAQYAAPQGGYKAPEGGYKAPVGGYKAPAGGYQYNRANYTPQNYDNGGGYDGINPALYMMMQPYNKGNNDHNYSHPQQFPQYIAQRPFRNGVGVGVGVNTGRYPYPMPYQPPMYPPMFFPPTPAPLPPIIGVEGGSCVSCGSSSRSYVPTPLPEPLPVTPCLMGMCQPLPCLSAQCMNRPTATPYTQNACMPLNQGYLTGLGVGNLNCIQTNGGIVPGNQPPNIGRPPVIGYPNVTNFPVNPGYPTTTIPNTNIPTTTIPYNPNLTPGYQTQYQSVPVSPTTYRVPRGIVRKK